MHSKSARQQFQEEGYLIFPEVFAGDELERLRTACNNVLARFTENHDRTQPEVDFISMRHLNDSRWHQESQEDYKIIMETVADPRCLGPVEQIFGGPSLFRCTSYFVNPRFASKEGDWHRDSQFGKTEEEEKATLKKMRETAMVGGFGLQFQIPLLDNEDIEIVPYSAGRYDSPEEYNIRMADNRSHCQEAGMPNAMRIKLRAGDGVVFNPYGLHRGRYHTDKPRRTLMLTYTQINNPVYDYFSDQPWFGDPSYLDKLSPRAKCYFKEFIEVYQSFWSAKKET